MAGRSRFLLAYDIRHPKRLRQVHEVAKSWGDPLQYSVFVCDLNETELILLKEALLDRINSKVDSIGIFDLGPATGRGVECVEFLGTHPPLPDQDSHIW